MCFISSQAKIYNRHPILTFDQPLYWKAIEIQKNKSEKKDSSVNDIILILGSFHTLMSYLGAVGHLMTGTGLQSLLGQVYADHTVPHMMSGKAVDRARRGHMLSLCALQGIIISKINDIDLSPGEIEDEGPESFISDQFLKNPRVAELAELLENTATGSIDVEQLIDHQTFQDHLQSIAN